MAKKSKENSSTFVTPTIFNHLTNREMKTKLFVIILLAAMTITSPALYAQKKVQTFTVSHIIEAPSEKVWAVVGEDYGAIANSHPTIVSSNYINGSLKPGEGAERVCHFNDKGTRFLKEK